MASPTTPEEPKDQDKYSYEAMDEKRGLSEDQWKLLVKHKDATFESEDFCRPYFEKALRFEKLYLGVLPEELDCTFSKCMLPLAFSMVENELPRAASTIFSTSLAACISVAVRTIE